MSDFYLGQIMIWPSTFAPKGWAFCDGRQLPIEQNSTLYSLLGGIYGTDNKTYFCLPDLRGKVIVGAADQYNGSSKYALGKSGGAESVVLTVDQLPSHSHPIAVSSSRAVSDNPMGNVPAKADMDIYAPASTGQAGQNTLPTGKGEPVSIIQPYLAINYLIAIEGVYPQRP